MKLTKLLASSLVVAMAFTSIVSAATTVEDAKALTPKLDIAVEQLTDSASINDVAGAAYLKRNPYDEATYDYYKLTYTFTELGNLRNDAFEDILGIYTIALGLNTTDIVSGGIKSSAVESTKTALGQDGRPGYEQYYNMTMEASGGVSNPFPAADTDNLEQVQEFSGSIEIPFVVAIADGTSVTVDDFYAQIVYIVDGVKQYENFNVITPDSVTIGKPAAELALEVTNTADTDTGYIWNASITKGEADINSFTAEFKAGAESATREVKNVGEILNKFEGGKVSFNIGLLTSRTLDEAKFTVGDAGGASANATVPMNQ